MDCFNIFAQNIHCGYALESPRRGGSNEYPQVCFESKIRKKLYPCIPQFCYIKVGFKGYSMHVYVFLMSTCILCRLLVTVENFEPYAGTVPLRRLSRKSLTEVNNH